MSDFKKDLKPNPKTIYNSSEPPFFDNEIDNEMLTTTQAAALLSISPQALLNRVSRGQVPYFKFGRWNRYRRGDLKELLFAHPRGGSNGS